MLRRQSALLTGSVLAAAQLSVVLQIKHRGLGAPMRSSWGTLIIRHKEGPLRVLLQEPYDIGLANGVVVLDSKNCRALDR